MRYISFCRVFRGFNTSSVTALALSMTSTQRLHLVKMTCAMATWKLEVVRCKDCSCPSCKIAEAFYNGLVEQSHFLDDCRWFIRNGIDELISKDAATAWEEYRAS